MTIVEREQVVAPLTKRERRARVLEAAALEIEVRGWARGTLCDSFGRVCSVGGVALALGYRLDLLVVQTTSLTHLYGEADEVFGRSYTTWLASWNDGRARDAEDVTFVLRWRAEEIRDGR